MAWGILRVVKERLTGAIILVALIVLLVPELLSGPPQVQPARRPVAAAAAAHTATGQPPIRSYTLQLAAHPSSNHAVNTTQASPPIAAPAPRVPAPHPSAAKTTPAPRHRPSEHARRQPKARTHASARAKPRTEPRTHRPPVHTGPRWIVQLGVFAIHGDALRLARRVRSHGVGVRVSPMRGRGRRLWRVSTTAVRGRAAGFALARRLRRMGIKGELLRQ